MLKAVVRYHCGECMASKRHLSRVALNEECVETAIECQTVQPYNFGLGAIAAEAALATSEINKKRSPMEISQNLVHDL
jgi:hypothetical protein